MAKRVLRSTEDVLNAVQHAMPNTTLKLLALYDSRLNAFITNPLFMRIPMIDEMLEGHGVFDTANIYEGHIYQLDRHLERLLESSRLARIPAPMTVQEMKEKVDELISIVNDSDMRIRLFISNGLGLHNYYSTTPSVSSSIFYALAYKDVAQNKPESVKEATVSVPIKPKILAIVKSNNYMTNALTVMEAREKGGYMGIQLDEHGNLTESAIANVACILPGGHFVTPKPDMILEGTTVKRVLEFCQSLIEEGVLSSAGRADIHVEQAKTAVEMMLLGGDHIVPIVELDGVTIGEGKTGPISTRIRSFLAKDHYSS